MKLVILFIAAATSLAAQTCPSQAVILTQASIPIGSNSVIKAPAGWYGGTFASSSTGVAPVHPHVPTLWYMATGVTAGTTAITGANWTAPNGASSCQLSATQLTVTALSASAKEVLVFDWNKAIPGDANRFTEGPLGNVNTSQNKVVRYNVDRTGPIDFVTGGTYHVRVKMGCMAANDQWTWQINHWKGNLGEQGEIYSHIANSDLNFTWAGSPITKTFTLPISELVPHPSRPAWDWTTNPLMTIMGFLANKDEDVPEIRKLDPAAYPLDMRMTIVNVGAGGTFSGWPAWQNHGLGERTYDCDFPTPVTIDAPSDGATISGATDINVTASDNVGVTKVEFSIDSGAGSLKATDNLAPFSWRWNPAGYAAGSHTITVKAYDMAGHTNSHAITVSIGGGPPTPIYPNPPDPGKISELNADLPYTPGTCHHTATDSSELSSALNSVSCGQTICATAGVTFSGNFIYDKNCGRNYVTLRTTSAAELPATTRVKPSDVAKFAKISKPTSGAGPITVRPGSSGLRLLGLEVTSAAGAANVNFVVLGSNNSNPQLGPVQTTPESVPHHFIVDRCYIHCPDRTTKCSVGVRVDANYVSVVNSYIDEIHDGSGDDQAILVLNGAGPYLLRNNFLHSAGENVMYGGGEPAIRHVPSDSWIEGNWFWKDPTRRTGDALYKVKNLFELKSGRRMKIYGNVFQNFWSGVQSQYYAIVWKSSNQNYCGPNNDVHTVNKNGYYNQTADIEFAYNKIIDIPQGFVFQRRAVCPISEGSERFFVHDNLITGLGSGHSQDGAPRVMLWAYPQQIGGTGEVLYPRNVIFSHNTVGSLAGGFGMDAYRYSHLETQGNYARNVYLHSNIYPGRWFVAGTYNNEATINDRFRTTLVSQHNLSISPSGTVFAGNPNYARPNYTGLLDASFRLTNPAQYPGMDGRPVGADITAVENCSAGATSSWGGNCAGGPPTTTVRLEANGSVDPITVVPGAAVKLEWFVTGATSCKASASTTAGGAIWNGAKSTSGGSQVINPTSSATYTLTCSGASSSPQSSVTVNTSVIGISAQILANNSSNAIVVAPGASVDLHWIIDGATSCNGTASTPEATAIWAGPKDPAGGTQTIKPTSSATYTIDCLNSSSGKTASASIAVNMRSTGLSLRMEANDSMNPITVVSGAAVKMEWFVQGASACEASASTPAGAALWNGAKSTSGGAEVIHPASTATYTITCSSSAGGTVQSSVVVNVAGVCAWPAL